MITLSLIFGEYHKKVVKLSKCTVESLFSIENKLIIKNKMLENICTTTYI